MHDEVGYQRVTDHDAPSIHPSVNLAVPQRDNSGFDIWSVSQAHLGYLQIALTTGNSWCTYTELSNNRDHMESTITSNPHPYIVQLT